MGKRLNGPGSGRGENGGPIAAGDRVASVIARDERLIDVFTSLSPAFERLRSPAMRKVMSRLVTVEQAARMAGVDPDDLVGRLNAAVGGGERAPRDAGAGNGGGGGGAGEGEVAAGAAPPPALSRIPEDRIVDLDVRDDLRQGREPFSRIMAARRTVPEGGVLRLRAIFEPVPLYAVMEKQGFAHWTERFAEDDWRVWFYRDASAAAATAKAPAAEAAHVEEEDVVVLDVRELEPPEPMVRTLEALQALPRGKTLVQLNQRIPQFLLPKLQERGFAWEVREQSPSLVRIFIRHKE